MKSTLSPTVNLALQHREAQSPESSAGLAWAELGLLLACVAALVLAIGGPSMVQADHYHAFADQRSLWGMPQTVDVLSNLPFALAGVVGLMVLRGSGHAIEPTNRWLAGLFFAGLIITSACSSIYHLQPANNTLALDRVGMVVAFAGLLGLAVADRVSTRAGRKLALGILIAGPLAVITWAQTGNLLPWAVLQGGGILLLLALLACKPIAGALGIPVGAVLAWYVLAKLFEMGDHQVFALTNGWVSGHSLKHVLAALAAWPVIRIMHNASASDKT